MWMVYMVPLVVNHATSQSGFVGARFEPTSYGAKNCSPLLLVLQHGSQLFPQVRIILFSMLGHRMVDRFVQDLFFRA